MADPAADAPAAPDAAMDAVTEAGDRPPSLSAIAIELAVEDERWAEALAGDDGLEALAAEAAALALDAAGVSPEGRSISVLFADDDTVARLNESFRGKAAPTNVLSWPAHELRAEAEGRADGARPSAPPPPETDGPWGGEPDSLGDVALAWETVAAEAEAQGIALADHVRHLGLHGVLHLLGYDHERDGDARLMEGLESEALLAAGRADPYLAQSMPADETPGKIPKKARPRAGAKKARSDGR